MIAIKGQAYFDRDVMKKRWSKMNETPLKRAGLLVRAIARRSIRSRKSDKPSPVGEPPRSRAAGKPLKMIFSVVNRWATRAIVGPVSLNKDSVPTPAVHEHGLRVKRSVFTKESGQRRSSKGRFRKKRTIAVTRSVKYPERPTMGPALKVARPKLPALWAGSLN